MKNFWKLLLAWYIQDVLQIFMTQSFPAPEVYVITLICLAARDGEEKNGVAWVFAALIGGLATDLRWLGVPGMCGALYISSLLLARAFWYQIPAANRRMTPYIFICTVLCVLLTVIRLLFWDGSLLQGRIITIVSIQWFLELLIILFTAFFRVYGYDEEPL